MKANYKLALGVLAGVAIGGGAIEARALCRFPRARGGADAVGIWPARWSVCGAFLSVAAHEAERAGRTTAIRNACSPRHVVILSDSGIKLMRFGPILLQRHNQL
jgi:hypothetical protein